jgi:hypothetical protein
MALLVIFFLWTCCRQGNEVFFPFFAASLSLSLTCPKTPTQPTLFSWPTIETKKTEGTSIVGILGAAAQLPPKPPYPFDMTGQG